MIDWLEIHQLAIAEHIALEFGGSFTAVTGETGSGKSLIVDAVCILLGGRCENALIRKQREQAEVHGGFQLGDSHPAMRWLREHHLDNHDECILRRVVRRDKPSRAYINGRAVNASQLREIGRELVDIHSQNEHHYLLRKKGQLALLDQAADNTKRVAQLEQQYEACAAVRSQIEQLQARSSMAQERAELLQLQIEELAALEPQADEWPQLEEQQKRMNHTHDLRTAGHAVAARLVGGVGGASQSDSGSDSGNGSGNEPHSVSVSLVDCCRQIQRLVEYDARLAKIIAMLEEANVHVSEAAAQLQTFYAERAFSAEEMAAMEARFSQYHELSRKHRTLPGLLVEKLAQMRAELSGLQDPQAELTRLEEQWRAHHADYEKLAHAISKNRRHAATRLSAAVTELMQELGMAGGHFEIRLQPIAQPNLSRYGHESVDFMVCANPGQDLQALGKVASGGELSRISLAINVILAAEAPDSTLILDEVDVGIGGKVAEIIGQKLRQIGNHRQVICITHLSQVAANGRHHWSVTKQTGAQANVQVQSLDHQQRITEIARMTAGADVTPQSLAHAAQMLQSGLQSA